MDKALLSEIVYRYKFPKHRSHRAKGRAYHAENLSCGDIITIYLQIEKGYVKSASYTGQLCSIASFGAELLLDKLIGQPISSIPSSADLLGASGASLLKNPVRLKCFELAQLALKNHSPL
ncbi:MAG: iron-sulfur cluster assembly scaffold protein [Candidatus Nomurabacteria bacterium]|jgi:NifU-like protein involved in Fe-S cluster formation|nr:iron-sulfur cluster assembly scaffold protein [Candidatus Nomurabacteria bacterium]